MKTDMKKFGYYRIGIAVPRVSVANPEKNAENIINLCETAVEHSPDIIVFPELSVTGYTCADLFYQHSLLQAAEDAVESIARKTKEYGFTVVVGTAVESKGLLYNCAAVLRDGEILGIVPKTFIPNSREFYELRWFASGSTVSADTIHYAGTETPFGTDILFVQKDLVTGIEICEDLWAPIPPSSYMNEANLILNLSASNELVGKAEYRKTLIENQSARCLCAYAYVSAGPDESTTDTVFGGHGVIAENGHVLGELSRFSRGGETLFRDIDVQFLRHERMNSVTYSQGISMKSRKQKADNEFRKITIGDNVKVGFKPTTDLKTDADNLLRTVYKTPFVPSESSNLVERCREIFSIQSSALATRLEHIGCKNAVIGLSGGLDSTLALLVTIEAFTNLDLDLSGISCITMPGFGTSGRTLGNVNALAKHLSLPLETIDIKEACKLHMEKLGHSGKPDDVAYENIQARERTLVLMNKANMNGGIVIGTGDLSELALGWCTYNGDHMSMYAVNSGVPKTLVKFLIQYVADSHADEETKRILYDIIDTPISPELLPPDNKGEIAQKTEEVIGPYELHDFFLYYGIRCGFPPAKVRLLAGIAFKDEYAADAIEKWSILFFKRFFSQQFKRSCLPDGPKVGTISLSPRGDWRMPSDADGSIWNE